MRSQRVSTVLITGASSGLGQTTARLLRGRGYRVFGGSRRPAPAGSGVEMVVLDVRDQESVDAAVRAVIERAERIDVLVNNAGSLLTGAIEETSIEEARAQLETNFFGVARMVRAVLPAMRAAGAGRIVNVSSLAGLISVPFEAYYAASKHALEGYTEALRHEVAPFGIHVSLVEPGFFRTSLHDVGTEAATRVAAYAAARERASRAISDSIVTAPDPARVAETVARVLAARRPRLRYRVGRDATWVPRLRALLPQSVFERAVRRRFGLAASRP